MALGVLYAILTGTQLILVLCVDNSDIQDLVKDFMFIMGILINNDTLTIISD